MRQKLRGKYTHRVVETMCRLSARHTYREAANAVEIVDYMHAKSHLYDVGKCVFGDSNRPDRSLGTRNLTSTF